MTKYHSDDYIKFLRSIRPDNMSEFSKQMQRCKWDNGHSQRLFDVQLQCYLKRLELYILNSVIKLVKITKMSQKNIQPTLKPPKEVR